MLRSSEEQNNQHPSEVRVSPEVQREQIKTWTCLEPRAAATVGEFLGELGRDLKQKTTTNSLRTSSSSSAADSLERLRRWGSEGRSTATTCNGHIATRAQPLRDVHSGGVPGRMPCMPEVVGSPVPWQVNGLPGARGRESCS